jgi:phosphonate C-P lyase system protein PhnG
VLKRIDSPCNRLVAEMDDESLSRLQRLLPLEEIEISRTPETGLLMMTARDCFDTDFCLGDILVTVAEAKVGKVRGYSMILGDDPRRAVLSASLDAILNGSDGKLKARLLRALRVFERRFKNRQRSEAGLPASTRVHFDAMPEG